jgi:hypothetical protein
MTYLGGTVSESEGGFFATIRAVVSLHAVVKDSLSPDDRLRAVTMAFCERHGISTG